MDDDKDTKQRVVDLVEQVSKLVHRHRLLCEESPLGLTHDDEVFLAETEALMARALLSLPDDIEEGCDG